jgi:hypothetical protein
MSYDHIRNAPGYAALIKKAQACLDTPSEVQMTWSQEEYRDKAFLRGVTPRGKECLLYPLHVHDGLVFVEHPKYGDEDAMQIMHADGTFSPSHAWDMDDLRHGDY